MKSILCGAIAAVGLAGAADAQRDMVRAHLEYIELPHQELTALLAGDGADSGPALHQRARALVKAGKGRILETCVLITQVGQRAVVESNREYIYPTEADFSAPPNAGGVPQNGLGFSVPFIGTGRPTTPTAFETRNLGVTVGIEAMVGENHDVIDLQLAPEMVNPLRLEAWVEHRDEWGEASLKTPVIETLRISTAISLQNGKFALAGVLTPNEAAGGLRTGRKLLLFVKADLIRVRRGDQDEERK